MVTLIFKNDDVNFYTRYKEAHSRLSISTLIPLNQSLTAQACFEKSIGRRLYSADLNCTRNRYLFILCNWFTSNHLNNAYIKMDNALVAVQYFRKLAHTKPNFKDWIWVSLHTRSWSHERLLKRLVGDTVCSSSQGSAASQLIARSFCDSSKQSPTQSMIMPKIGDGMCRKQKRVSTNRCCMSVRADDHSEYSYGSYSL